MKSIFKLLFFLLLLPFFGFCQHEMSGLTRHELTHDKYQREYWLYKPEGHQGKLPVVIVMHGGGGTAEKMVKATFGRFNELADEHGFLVVYPQGLKRGWNDHRTDPISFSQRNEIDDVGFIDAMLDELVAKEDADPERIFATGISNGGFMAFRLGCQLGNRIRAIAPVTATMPEDGVPLCRPADAVGLLLINGTADPLVPYEGGQVHFFRQERGAIISTDSTMKFWADWNACEPELTETALPDSDPSDGTSAVRYSWTSCPEVPEIVLIKVIGGGHTWPGGLQYAGEKIVGKTSRDFNACDVIWEFFGKY